MGEKNSRLWKRLLKITVLQTLACLGNDVRVYARALLCVVVVLLSTNDPLFLAHTLTTQC